MADPRTHYEVLGVPTGADPAEIRRAYVKLARRFHPDSHPDRSVAERDHAARRMREVNAAWTALSDPERRRAYDETMVRARPRPNANGASRPEGHGWRPLADDDGWQSDFESWRRESDVLPPDVPGPRRPTRILPAAILVAGGLVAVIGLVLSSRPVLAVSFMLAGISAALWVWLPLAELARSRREDPDL